MSTSAASDKVKSIITGLDINIIKNIDLLPISKGAVDESKAEIKANDLIDMNTDEPVLFYISEQAFGARTKLVGIIKEVAPTKDAEDDETLGVNDFHENYFLGLPLFMDSKMSFHNSLGRRKIGDVGFSTWNPFSIMGRLWRAIMAIRAMGIDGNLKGEGNILGGVIVVQPTKGIIYSFQEKMGEPFPYDAISEAIEGVASEGAKAATKDATIFTSGETCERKEDCA